MSHTLPLSAAIPKLPELIAGIFPGDEIILTENGAPIAVVTRAPRTSWPCEPGSAAGTSHWMAPDFNEPLGDFKECMEREFCSILMPSFGFGGTIRS